MYTVLYVDDEPALLEIGRLFLEKNGQFDVETRLSASSALEALRCRHYDAIVSDYQMPGMDGIGFLKAVRSQFGDIPFILFTGKGREEVAIAAINNGVNFYLQKGGDPGVQFAELEHGVLQAVLRREAEQSLRRSEERYRSVVDDQTEMIARFTADGTITFVNESYRSYFAPLLDLGEVTGRNIRELMQVRDSSEVEAFLASLAPDSPTREMERVVVGRDGKTYCQRYSVRALFGDGGAPAEFQVVGRDVTAERQAEQAIRLRESRLGFMLGFYEMARQPEEALLEYAVEGAGIVTDSPLGYLAFLNSDESELTMHAWSRSATEECALRTKPIVYKTEKTGLWGEAVRQRRPVITNDYPAPNPLKKGYPVGHPPIRRHMNVPILEGDRIVIVAGVANKETDYSESDVSELSLLMQGLWQVLKRKRAEESLRESEEKYRLATETTGQLVYDYDIPGGRIGWSGAIEQVTGCTPEEFQAVDIAAWKERVHPDDRETALAELKAATERAGEYHVEYRFRKKDGTYIPMEDTGAFITDAAGRARRMVGTQKDLSKRRQVEEALRLSEERYRGMAERISDIVLLVDRDFHLAYISPSFESLTGTSALPLLGHPLPLDRLRPEDREKIEGAMRRNQALEPAGPLEIAFPARDGGSVILEFHGTPILEDGRFAGVQLVAHDITGLREAQDELRGAYEQVAASEEELRAQFEMLARSEQQLRESEARFRAIFDHASAALTLSDAERNVCLAANPAFERITGHPVAEAIGRDAAGLTLVTPELEERLEREFRDRGAIDTSPITFARRDGEERQGLLSSIPIRVDDRPAILTLVVDVTDQHRAAAARRESEERLRSFFEAMIEAVFITDEEGLVAEWNPAAERISGLPRTEVLGIPAWEVLYRVLPPERRTEVNRTRLEALIREGLRTGAPFSPPARQVEIERSDGTRVVIRQTVFSIPSPSGSRFGSIALDITEQIHAEEVLRESEQRFRRLFEQTPLGIAQVGPDFRFRTVNPAMCRMLGYPAEELVGNTFSSVTYPEDVPLGLAETTRILRGEASFFRMEKRYLRKDGSLLWGLVTVFPITDDQGRVLSLIPVIEDNTERRLAENALRTANRQLTLLSSITRHDILNNVMVMLGYLALGKRGSSDPGTMALIEKLEATTRQIRGQIEFTGLFEHLGSRDPEWQAVPAVLGGLQVPEGVTLTDDSAGWEVYGDVMLGHVFSNLLDNSIRHGETVSGVKVGAEETDRGLAIVYEDNGVGIPAEEKETIFERGYGKHTGLGLFLAREVLALTGITIRETGVPGTGARFELMVPKGSYRSGTGE